MAAEDELAIPEVPEAKPEDPEDVSWALSTAEAMWARGDHLEGIKWVRKAAEAASEVENDERALELAKAASNLTALIARRSRASISDGPGLAGGAPPDFVPQPPPPPSVGPTGTQPPSAHGHTPASVSPRSTPASVPPNTSRMGGAPALPPNAVLPRELRAQSIPPPAPIPSSHPAPLSPRAAPGAPAAPAPLASTASSPPAPVPQTAPPTAGSKAPPTLAKSGVGPIARSIPPGPIPLPSRASVAPRAIGAPAAPAAATPASSGLAAGRAAPRPLATSDARQGPQPGRGVLSNRVAEAPKVAKGRRRSRENLEAEARAAGLLDTAPQPAVDSHAADQVLANDMGDVTDVGAVEMPVANTRVKRRSRPDGDAVVQRSEPPPERQRSADEWDASPTQNLTGDEMDAMSHGDRKTSAFAIPVSVDVALPSSMNIPVAVARPPMTPVHDPEIQTSQAVRVVVWRDGTGVHVAPAGTVVSSITIDAVLVVLEPSADLTAWLSQRER
jgi:hypothetical protein